MSKYLVWSLRIIRNKYWVTLAVFVVWIAFFDSNSFINQYKLSRALSKLKGEKAFYIREIAKDKATAEGLLFNLDNLEKLAREKYYMSRPDEDVFLLIEETDEEREARMKVADPAAKN